MGIQETLDYLALQESGWTTLQNRDDARQFLDTFQRYRSGKYQHFTRSRGELMWVPRGVIAGEKIQADVESISPNNTLMTNSLVRLTGLGTTNSISDSYLVIGDQVKFLGTPVKMIEGLIIAFFDPQASDLRQFRNYVLEAIVK